MFHYYRLTIYVQIVAQIIIQDTCFIFNENKFNIHYSLPNYIELGIID